MKPSMLLGLLAALVTLFDGDGGTAYSIAVARDGTVRGGR
jgi:hypothetical protein